MQFRPAKESDLHLLVQHDRDVNLTPWTKQDYENCFEHRGQRIHLATDNGKLVGCIVYNMVVDETEILQFWVVKDCQRHGYGKQMLAHLLYDLRRKHHMERVFLEVRENNASAIALYQQLGFIQVGRRSGYYRIDGWSVDAIVMLKYMT